MGRFSEEYQGCLVWCPVLLPTLLLATSRHLAAWDHPSSGQLPGCSWEGPTTLPCCFLSSLPTASEFRESSVSSPPLFTAQSFVQLGSSGLEVSAAGAGLRCRRADSPSHTVVTPATEFFPSVQAPNEKMLNFSGTVCRKQFDVQDERGWKEPLRIAPGTGAVPRSVLSKACASSLHRALSTSLCRAPELFASGPGGGQPQFPTPLSSLTHV